MPVIVGAIVVALLAIGGLITAIAMNQGESTNNTGTDDPTASESAQVGGRGPDRTRTLETTKCTSALEDGTDPAKVQAPNLLYKDLLSVKECLRAAGWTWTVTEVNNPQYPQDAVVEQYPSQGQAVAPRNQEFELKVSTGKAA
jgi:hypothetical protein